MILDYLSERYSLEEIKVDMIRENDLAYGVDRIYFSDNEEFRYEAEFVAFGNDVDTVINNTLHIFKKNESGEYVKIQSILDTEPKKTRQAHGIASTPDGSVLFVGHHDATINGVVSVGYIRVYTFDIATNTYVERQLISNPEPTIRDYFGASICVTSDCKLLYIGAHNKDTIYIYKMNNDGMFQHYSKYVSPDAAETFGIPLILVEDKYILSGTGKTAQVSGCGTVAVMEIFEDGGIRRIKDILPNFPVASGNFGDTIHYCSASRTLVIGQAMAEANAQYFLYKYKGDTEFVYDRPLSNYPGTAATMTRIAGSRNFSLIYDCRAYRIETKRVTKVVQEITHEGTAIEQHSTMPVLDNNTLSFCSQKESKPTFGTYDLIRIGNNNGSRFGVDLALSKNGLVLYVCSDKTQSTVAEDNYVFRYVRETTDSEWVYDCKLQNPDPLLNNAWGRAVATNFNGDLVAVGSPQMARNTKGYVALYTIVDSKFVKIDEIVLRNYTSFSNQGGQSLAMSADGNTLFIGSNSSTVQFSVVTVLTRDDNASPWKFKQDIKGSRASFGMAVDLSPEENALVIGEPGYKDAAGYVHIYRLLDDVWTHTYSLKATAWYGNDVCFGNHSKEIFINEEDTGLTLRYEATDWNLWKHTLTYGNNAVSNNCAGPGLAYDRANNLLIAGQYRWKAIGSRQNGIVRSYDRHANVVDHIYPPLADALTGFGRVVAVSKDGVWVAATSEVNEAGQRAGMISIFKFEDGRYNHMENLDDVAPQTVTRLGHSLVFSGNGEWLFAGNPQSNSNGGRVYIYRLEAGKWLLKQTIENPTAAKTAFGSAIASDYDGTTLFIGNNNAGVSAAGQVKVLRYMRTRENAFTPIADQFAFLADSTDGAGATSYAMTVSGDGETLLLAMGRSVVLYIYRLNTFTGTFSFHKKLSLGTINGNIHQINLTTDKDCENTLVSIAGSTEKYTKIFHIKRQGLVWTLQNEMVSDYAKISGFDGPSLVISNDGKFAAMGVGTSINGTTLRKDSTNECPKVFAMSEVVNAKAYDGNEYYSEIEDAAISEPIIPVNL